MMSFCTAFILLDLYYMGSCKIIVDMGYTEIEYVAIVADMRDRTCIAIVIIRFTFSLRNFRVIILDKGF